MPPLISLYPNSLIFPVDRSIIPSAQKVDDTLGIYSCDLIEMEKVRADFKALIRRNGKIIYERKRNIF